MKRYWWKLGNYVILMLATILSSLVADFVWLVVESALSFTPLIEGVLGLVFNLLVCGAVVLVFAIKDGYAKRAFSLKVNLAGGGLFVVLHGVLYWLIPLVGPLGGDLADLLYYGNEIAYAEVDPTPFLLRLVCVIAMDVLFYIPLMTLGDHLGVRSYREEIQELKEEHTKKRP